MPTENTVNPQFDNTYTSLPDRFFTPMRPEPVSEPRTIRVNRSLAEQLRVDPEFLASEEGARVATGNALLEGATPIATVYAGHQFGSFNPQLGDGRAILLGELIDVDGQRFDLQLKGSGRTPYSRGGDGRSPLGPVLREYIVSEAMAALGVPTTRSLAAATTGERVRREGLLPGAVLMRVAQSHIRIGTFEYFAARQDTDALAVLLDYVIERHYPELSEAEHPPLALLRTVAEKQAELVAQWMLVGFIHGVMNTDNMLLSGETIDYGPCAFMDRYDPKTVFSFIDRMGRYAYRNQPGIAQWNIAAFARAILPLVDTTSDALLDEAQSILDGFPAAYARAFSFGMARKLGFTPFRAGDAQLVDDLLKLMESHALDFTLTLRRLTDLAGETDEVGALISLPEALSPWLERWQARLSDDPTPLNERVEAMRGSNPIFIPRNHQVEAAIRDGEDRDDFERFHTLVDVLSDPFTWRAEDADYALPASPDEAVCVTYCGT